MSFNVGEVTSVSPDTFLYKKLALKPGQEMDENSFCLVRITEDVRDTPNKADGKLGVYLGKYDLDTLDIDDNDTVTHLKDARKSDSGNPVIQIGENEYILGIQCWWQPVIQGEIYDLESAKEELAISKKVLAILLGIEVVELEGSNDNL